jgi:ADP-ribose pyrophosphatase YjhB (NUDIX family)
MYTTQFVVASFQDLVIPEAKKYENPTPIAVAVVPVRARDPKDGLLKTGLLVGERGIESGKGKFALPGGYIEREDWRDALRREVFEETQISLPANGEIETLQVESVEDGRRILIFGKVSEIPEESLNAFTPSNECPRIKVIFEPEPLAYKSHEDITRRFFERS